MTIAGAFVGLGFADERNAVERQRSSLHGNLPRGRTAEDGTFAFTAPAGCRYQIACRALPNSRELWVKGPTFAAPAGGLIVTVRDADRQGFVLSGRVVAADDGAAVPRVKVSRTTFDSPESRSSDSVGEGENGDFEIGPLAIGKRCTFVFEADGFARTQVGPFEATVRREVVTVRMLRCGKVRVRVLRPDGTPAIKVMASLQRTVDDPFGRAWQGETDDDGCVVFTDVVPEAFKVHAFAAAAEGGRAVGDTVVQPGRISEVQLVLQR